MSPLHCHPETSFNFLNNCFFLPPFILPCIISHKFNYLKLIYYCRLPCLSLGQLPWAQLLGHPGSDTPPWTTTTRERRTLSSGNLPQGWGDSIHRATNTEEVYLDLFCTVFNVAVFMPKYLLSIEIFHLSLLDPISSLTSGKSWPIRV